VTDPNLDAAMYLVARGGNWRQWTAFQPLAQREAMADAARRYEDEAVDAHENGGLRLDENKLRWWRT
jgi:hypothetical protein